MKSSHRIISRMAKVTGLLLSCFALFLARPALAAGETYLVEISPALDANDAIDILEDYGFSAEAVPYTETTLTVRPPEDGRTVSQVLSDLDAIPGVEFAEVDESCQGLSLPSDTYAPLQWNLRAAMFFDTLPDPAGETPVTVAVLDSGVAYNNIVEGGVEYRQAESFQNVIMVPGYDIVNRDSRPLDDNGHGTMVASIIAAGVDDALGICGIMPPVRIMPIKVLDHNAVGSQADLVSGIMLAVAQGADVIVMSLAIPPEFKPSPILARAVSYAARQGVVMVAAAGNNGGDQVSYPAAFPGVIAVGASAPLAWTNASAPVPVANASYSPVSNDIDIVAPGGDLEHDRNGDGLVDGVPAEGFSPGAPADLGYYLFAGTSAAAAHAGAAAALLLSHGAHPDQVPSLMRRSGFELTGGMKHLNAKAALDALNDNSPALVLADVSIKVEAKPRYVKVIAGVSVIDQQGQMAPGHQVKGHWVGLKATSKGTSCTTGNNGRCTIEAVTYCVGFCQVASSTTALKEALLPRRQPLAGFMVDQVFAPGGQPTHVFGIANLYHESFGVIGIAAPLGGSGLSISNNGLTPILQFSQGLFIPSLGGSGLSISNNGMPLPQVMLTTWLTLRQEDLGGSGLSISNNGLPRILLTAPLFTPDLGGSGLSISNNGLTVIDLNLLRTLTMYDQFYTTPASLAAGRLAPLDALDAISAMAAAGSSVAAMGAFVPTDPSFRLTDEAISLLLPSINSAQADTAVRLP